LTVIKKKKKKKPPSIPGAANPKPYALNLTRIFAVTPHCQLPDKTSL